MSVLGLCVQRLTNTTAVRHALLCAPCLDACRPMHTSLDSQNSSPPLHSCALAPRLSRFAHTALNFKTVDRLHHCCAHARCPLWLPRRLTQCTQRAIDECGDLPTGGTVLVPKGILLTTASLWLRSNLSFRVEEGATVLGTQLLDDAPMTCVAPCVNSDVDC